MKNRLLFAFGLLLLLISVLLGVAAGSTSSIAAPTLKWQHGGCYSSWCETGWYSSPAVADLEATGELPGFTPDDGWTFVPDSYEVDGRSVVVRINDRGPFVGHRIIDVSQRAAEQLGMIRAGSARVRIELPDPDQPSD